MNNRYPIPDLCPTAVHRETLVIQRSRFIVHFGHTPNTERAKTFIQRIQQAYPEATHNCWAFAVGPPADTAHVGYSDDGEPKGTAGRPMLTVLLHGGVGQITAVVTRYFGGIKLGTGGLVRAYQQLVKMGLESLPIREHCLTITLEVVIDYAHVTPLLRLLPTLQATITSETFGVDVTYVLTLPADQLTPFTTAITELTGGAVLISPSILCGPAVQG